MWLLRDLLCTWEICFEENATDNNISSAVHTQPCRLAVWLPSSVSFPTGVSHCCTILGPRCKTLVYTVRKRRKKQKRGNIQKMTAVTRLYQQFRHSVRIVDSRLRNIERREDWLIGYIKRKRDKLVRTCLSFGPKVVGSGLTFSWNHIIGNLGTASMSARFLRSSLRQTRRTLTVGHLSNSLEV